MKLLQCVIYCYLFYCILDDVGVGADFNGFIVNVRTEVGSAVSSAWNSLITAIKKPVRIRNIRRKRRTTTTPSSDIVYRDINPESYHFTSSDQTEADIEAISADTSDDVPETQYKPKIPVINQPEWKSLVDWTSLQRPSLVQLIQEIRQRRRDGTTISSLEAKVERTKRISAENDEDRHFGILIFA